MVSGRLAVRRLQGLYEVGARRWLRRAWVAGLLVGVLGVPAPALAAVVFDAPWILLVFLTGTGFAMLDFVRFVAVRGLSARLARHRMLDGAAMLPALALYARHHGWRAAISGVPAGSLAATLAAHPDEVRIALEYAEGSAFMSRLARLAGGAGGAAGPA